MEECLKIASRLWSKREEIIRGHSDSSFVQFIQNGFASGIAFIFDFGLLVTLTELAGVNYLLSGTIAFFVGHMVHYAFCVLWIFPQRRFASRLAEIGAFMAVGVAGVGMNAFVLWVFTEPAGIPYKLSKLIAVIIVYFFNFFTKKYIVFYTKQG